VLANIGLTLTMMIVVGFLYYRKKLNVFPEYFGKELPVIK
jgi:hypothetical protein